MIGVMCEGMEGIVLMCVRWPGRYYDVVNSLGVGKSVMIK